MNGHTRGVSRGRTDFVRDMRSERCWIDGDLIRLASWPVGGARPGGRAGPIPWLMDLAVLETAMQSVYGCGFRLGDRAPLLQMAADALAAGERTRAAHLADAVCFPPPEYASRFRNACAEHLNWGPAHRRGNPSVGVRAWQDASAWERKYDPNQPRVPRGHPDGGQWTDGPGGPGFDPDRPVTDEEWQVAQDVVGRVYERLSVELQRRGGPLNLVAARRSEQPDPLIPPSPWDVPDPQGPFDLLRRLPIPPHYPTPTIPGFPRTERKPDTALGMVKWAINKIRYVRPTARTFGLWGWAFDLVGAWLPDVATYFDEPQPLDELRISTDDVSFRSIGALEYRYGGRRGGYQLHHIVEHREGRNDDRGWDLHSSKNVVWVPTVKHMIISAHYSSKPGGPGSKTVREWLSTEGYERQREYGLWVLRWHGVLK